MPSEIRASDTLRVLIRDYDSPTPLKQRRIHQMILDGRIEAQRRSDGFWVKRGNLPAIAAILGMTPKSRKIAA